MLSISALLFSLVSTSCPDLMGIPGCGDTSATNLVKDLFNQNSGYRASRIELIAVTAENLRTRTCQCQIIDTRGNNWLVSYRMSPSATNSEEFVMIAEWRLMATR